MEVEVRAEKFDETKSNTFQDQSLPAKKIREARSLITIKDRRSLYWEGFRKCRWTQLNRSIIY